MDFGKDSISSVGRLEQPASTQADLRSSRQTNKASGTSQSKSNVLQNGSAAAQTKGFDTKTKGFNNVSMDEINKMINERVQQV